MLHDPSTNSDSILGTFFPVPRDENIEALSLEEKGAFLDLCRLAAFRPHITRTPDGIVIALSHGQLAKAVRTLAEAWRKTKDWVARRLKKFISLGLINVAKSATQAAKAPDIITVCFSKLFYIKKDKSATQSETHSATQARHKRDANKEEKGNNEQSEKESCAKQASPCTQGGKPRFGFPDAEEAIRAMNAPPAEPEKQTRKLKRQIPPDWVPGEKLVAWARNGEIGASDREIEVQAEQFRDHHRSKGNTFIDFDAAFRTWMRNSKKFSNHSKQTKSFKQMDREAEFTL